MPARSESLRVGIYENPPKIFRNEEGRPAGFWPALTNGILRDLGYDVAWVDCVWSRCLELLAAGKLDIMPDVAHSEQRAALFRMVNHPVLYAWSSILVRDSASVGSLEDLKGLRVAVVEDSIQADVLAELLASDPGSRPIVEVTSMEETARSLSAGEADAAIVNSFFARAYRDRGDIHVATIPFDVSTLHFALSPDAPPGLRAALNLAIYQQQITPDSAFNRAQQRWISQQAAMLPEWFLTAVAAATVLILISLGMIVALRRTVRIRTASLRDTVSSLQSEIAQREHAEAKMLEAQRVEALGRLVGGVAHDFNNMLAVIVGNLEMLSDEIRAGKASRLLDDAITAAERAASLTRQLLSFGRRASLQPEVVDLNATLLNVDSIMRRVLPETIRVDSVRADGLWKTCLDVAQFESALLNLALNARDAMPEGGRLTIETANKCLASDSVEAREADIAPGRYILVRVSDTGVGMTDEVRTKAIEPFFTTKPVGQGSGMGLAMVFGFMKQSGGGLRLLSEAGNGLTVDLYFPATDDDLTAIAPVRESRMGTAASEHILLVEDDDQVRNVIAQQLASLGYGVTAVDNAQAALDRLVPGCGIDLLLTDIVMPGSMQGPGLGRIARDRFPRLPVIFMSGYPQLDAAHGGDLRPDDMLLMKPLKTVELEKALKSKLAAAHSTG